MKKYIILFYILCCGVSFSLNCNPMLITNRGFTGHEYLPEFRIINMKGRLYYPAIGRFFSPDNFVQMPDFTQSLNRYSYCLNNPINYVDPSGQMFVNHEWEWNIRSNQWKWINDRGGDETQYVNIIDGDGNNFGQYEFQGSRDNLITTYWQSKRGNTTFSIFSEIYGANSTGHWRNTAALLGSYLPAGFSMEARFFSPATADISYFTDHEFTSIASGAIEYSPINVGDFIGFGFALKGLASWGAKMLGANIAKGGGRAFFSGAGTEAKALSQGYTTIGQTRAGQNLMKLTSDMPYYPGSDAYKMWGRLSTQWAKGATGEVHVFQNAATGVDLRSIWRMYEYPALKANPNITIIYHY